MQLALLIVHEGHHAIGTVQVELKWLCSERQNYRVSIVFPENGDLMGSYPHPVKKEDLNIL